MGENMYIRKLFFISIIIILFIPSICLADDILQDCDLDNFIEVSTDSTNETKEPTTNSKHIIAIDRKSLTVLYEKQAYDEVPMASTTKIMTAILTIENCNLNDSIEFSKNAATVRGSCLEVKKGDKISINDALYGLMMRSR